MSTPMWDELKPLERSFKGEDEVYLREDSSGKYMYARHADGSWTAWNPQVQKWQTCLAFFGDVLKAYVDNYYTRREEKAPT